LTLDPRPSVLRKRLSGFSRIVPILSPKGGVGKTTFAVALALTLGQHRAVSLLDLDINNPTAHIVLGVDAREAKIEEDKGILPVRVSGGGLEFMSIALFTRDRLLPLRGKDAVNAIIELLSTTRWSGSIMVIDTPPGFSDEVMEILRLCRGVEPVVVSTPDILSVVSTQRIVEVLREEGVRVVGIVGNMCRDRGDAEMLRKRAELLGVKMLTCVPWIEGLQKLFGDPMRLAEVFKPHVEPVAALFG